jgi:hypothetical protein
MSLTGNMALVALEAQRTDADVLGQVLAGGKAGSTVQAGMADVTDIYYKQDNMLV